jgi:ribosomal protein S18 acetylase RimI-like enzyme
MKTGSIGIRRARLEDAAGIANVHDSAWRFAYRGMLPGVELERMISRRGRLWWERAIRRRVSILVLDFDEEVRGYVTFGASRARSLPYRFEIYELYVQPEYIGLGFGTELFRAAQSRFRPSSLDVVVWTLADNTTACTFYTKLGGRAVATAEERFGGVSVPKVAFAFDGKKTTEISPPKRL